MLVKESKLLLVNNKDVINGTIVIPNNIEIIDSNAFKNCSNLININIPESVKIINSNAFVKCINLKTINLPCELEYIGDSAFLDCLSLEQINIPKKINIINSNTFKNCKSLKSINILGNIEEIKENAFSNCEKLLSFEFKNTLKKIYRFAFNNCISLTHISLPSSIKQIYERVFNGCKNIEKVIFSSSLTNATDIIPNLVDNNVNVDIFIYDRSYSKNDLNDIKNIRIHEMLKRIYTILVQNNHIYNLDKDKLEDMYKRNFQFKDILDTMIYNSVTEKSNYDKELIKFDNLFPKTRLSNLPSGIIFDNLNDYLIFNYNVKMMRKVKKLDIFNSINLECENVVSNVISFFGLFEPDGMSYHRFELLKKILRYKYFFNKSEYMDMKDDIKKYFIYVPSKSFLLDDNAFIPNEFEDYLKKIMSSNDVKKIKKLTNRRGKIINDYFRNNYSLIDDESYVLNKNLSDIEINEVNNYILSSSLDNQMTYNNLNEIFKNINCEYNEEILNFFIKNIDIIVSKRIYRLKFHEIVERYNEIKKYYLKMGNSNFSYYEAYYYLCETTFLNVKRGNYEFEQMVKKAGITSQDKFEKYQDLYEKIKDKKYSYIPRIKDVMHIRINDKDYEVLGEMLRKDDPFSLLVGELSYTDCCQRLNDNGYECLIHAINDGRIFCTYLIDGNKKILLSQSWVWRNGNVICFDNIEGTNYMKSDTLYSNLVSNIYKNISYKIVEEAHKLNDKIDVIMVGRGNNSLDSIKKYFGEEKSNKVYPPSYYGYLDSSGVYYIYGTEKLINTNYKMKKIYSDERTIVNENGINITTKSISKISKINSKYNNINFGFELSDLLKININDISIIYGEDWYIIYKDVDSKLSIIDSDIIESSTKEELIIQKEEILNVYKLFIDKYGISLNIFDNKQIKTKRL